MVQDTQLQAVLQAPKLTRTPQASLLLQEVLAELPSTLLASFVGAAAFHQLSAVWCSEASLQSCLSRTPGQRGLLLGQVCCLEC